MNNFWIPTEERLPELTAPLNQYVNGKIEPKCEKYFAKVLAYRPDIGVYLARLNKYGSWRGVPEAAYKFAQDTPTHWAPIPDVPIDGASEPLLKTIEVWVEGFSVTGDRGPAQLLGSYEASDFSEAVFQYLSEASLENKRLYRYAKQSKSHSIWGCRLFDNEADARKSFG